MDYSHSISFSANPAHSFDAAQVYREIAYSLEMEVDDIFLHNLLATDLLQHSSNQRLLHEMHESKQHSSSNTSLTEKTEGVKARSRKGFNAYWYGFKTRSENENVDDGYEWLKCGKKFLKSSPHPRNYYRYREAKCSVKKRVERNPKDDGIFMVTYEGFHNRQCPFRDFVLHC